MQPLITLLPNETIEDIFKFVSYKNLCYNIRPTNYLFSQLSAKLIDKLYPREVSLTIKVFLIFLKINLEILLGWNSCYKLRYFECTAA